MGKGAIELRSAGPARGVLRAPAPNGRIESMRVLPSAMLAPFVHHFWSVRWALRTPFEAEALAHPAAQIVFEKAAGVFRAEVSGVRTARVAMRRSGEGYAFGITFRPAMFQPLLGASMASITNRVMPITDVLGPKANAWARAVHAEPAIERQGAMLDAFLAPLLLPLQPEVARVRDVVALVASDRSIVRVEDACDRVRTNARALQRCFRMYVGVSPKWVIRRYRLHEAAEQLKGPRAPELASLAASLGYADQAHFAREFKLVIGQTPRSFAHEWRAGPAVEPPRPGRR